MTTPETRGYLVGLNQKNQFVVPEKLMNKIVESTGNTALMIWLPFKKRLHIQSVNVSKVIKIIIWFDHLTYTIFEDKLNPIIERHSEALIYNTGVLFPDNINDLTSIELYFEDKENQRKNLNSLKNLIEVIDGISKVDIIDLEKFIGD